MNNTTLILILALLLSPALFAQGTPHIIFGQLQYTDGTPPETDCIEYTATLLRTDELIYYNATHTSAVECTLTTTGLFAIQTAHLAPLPGDTIRIEFQDICDECISIVDTMVIVNSNPFQDIGIVYLPVCAWIDESDVYTFNYWSVDTSYSLTFIGEEYNQVTLIEIYDVFGRHISFNEWEVIEMFNPSGIYIIKLYLNDGTARYLKKVIVN